MSGLLRVATASEYAATAAIRFREQYRDWSVYDTFADGKTKADVDAAFNTQQHTPENVAAILNEGWAYPMCACCGGYFSAVVQMKQEWESETVQLCANCIGVAAQMLSGVDARAAIAKVAPVADPVVGVSA